MYSSKPAVRRAAAFGDIIDTSTSPLDTSAVPVSSPGAVPYGTMMAALNNLPIFSPGFNAAVEATTLNPWVTVTAPGSPATASGWTMGAILLGFGGLLILLSGGHR